MKIKKWFRKKYIYWKYKHNWNTGKLIVLKEEDRHLGLTTMMMKDCIEKDYILLVDTESTKKYIVNEIFKRGQLGFIPVMTEKEFSDKYLLSLNDIRIDKHRGRYRRFIVDNSCHGDAFDLKTLHQVLPDMKNGFIYLDIAA